MQTAKDVQALQHVLFALLDLLVLHVLSVQLDTILLQPAQHVSVAIIWTQESVIFARLSVPAA